MSDDTSYGDVTSAPNYFQRLGKAIGGVVAGLLMFLVSFGVLFWNEGRAVDRAQALEEAGGAVVTVSAEKVDEANKGKLVHIIGEVKTGAPVLDEELGVSAEKVVRLDRKAEIFQWTEKVTDEKVDKNKTKKRYDYSKAWVGAPVDSSAFNKREGHENSGSSLPVSNKDILAKDVKLGAFTLPDSLIRKIPNHEPFVVPDSTVLPEAIKTANPKAAPVNGVVFFPRMDGDTPDNPGIGDVKVSYTVVKAPDKVSIIAEQINATFQPYHPKTATSEVEVLKVGEFSSKQLLDEEVAGNNTMTWLLRLVGFALMAIGICLFLGPISAMTDFIPGVSGMVGCLTTIIAIIVALPLTLITIAIAWVAYRPVLGSSILAVALLFLGGAVYFIMSRRKAKVAGTGPPPRK